MSENGMSYDASPEPTGKFSSRDRNPDRGITVDEGGRMNYASAAATGHIEIELPSLPGSPGATERLHVKDFGPHVAGKIEASMKQAGYLRSGPQQTAPQVFAHYVACARGASLMDPPSLKRMESLGREFSDEPEQRQYFEMVVKPYLLDLAPKRR